MNHSAARASRPPAGRTGSRERKRKETIEKAKHGIHATTFCRQSFRQGESARPRAGGKQPAETKRGNFLGPATKSSFRSSALSTQTSQPILTQRHSWIARGTSLASEKRT